MLHSRGAGNKSIIKRFWFAESASSGPAEGSRRLARVNETEMLRLAHYSNDSIVDFGGRGFGSEQ